MHQSVSRRSLVTALALSPVLLPRVSMASAQDSGPFADLGLPELNLTVTATAIEGMPASIESGRYLVTVTVSEETGDAGGGLLFIRPSGDSSDAFLPLVTLEAPPLPEDEYDALLYSAGYPGGIYVNAGETAEIVIDLAPGNWIVAGGFQNPQLPIQFEVTGDLPASLPEPVSTATIVMADYSIEIAEGELQAGTQVIRVENAGAEIHHLFVARSTVPVTSADLEAVLQAEMTGTPATVDFNPDEDLIYTLAIAETLTDTTLWVAADLEPGTWVFLCFVPARTDEVPHALHGMSLVVDIPE